MVPSDKNPAVPPAAKPCFGAAFDPWNSVALGHQRAETNPGTGWRASRTRKLQSQLAAGGGGGARLSDTFGAGAADFDEGLRARVPAAVRARAANSVVDMLRRPGRMQASLGPGGGAGGVERETEGEEVVVMTAEERRGGAREGGREEEGKEGGSARVGAGRGKMFDGVVVYVNGSTHPLVSDHRLKQLLAENGGRVSIHLGRRQVTHVVLGRPAGVGSGAGGGLAGGKLEREIRRVGGCGVKFVGVEWVLESIKAGRRLPEARFANLKVAARGQQSVYGLYARSTGTRKDDGKEASRTKPAGPP